MFLLTKYKDDCSVNKTAAHSFSVNQLIESSTIVAAQVWRIPSFQPCLNWRMAGWWFNSSVTTSTVSSVSDYKRQSLGLLLRERSSVYIVSSKMSGPQKAAVVNKWRIILKSETNPDKKGDEEVLCGIWSKINKTGALWWGCRKAWIISSGILAHIKKRELLSGMQDKNFKKLWQFCFWKS